MIVVANSSPLIYLAKLNQLDLLEKLYKKVFVPKAVFDEVVFENPQYEIEIKRIKEQVNKTVLIEPNSKEVISDFSSIHAGETQTILLALRKRAQLVLLDDKKARGIAELRGLNVQGTLGVLIEAFYLKLVSANDLRKLINDLIGLDFRISVELYAEVMEVIRESEQSKAYKSILRSVKKAKKLGVKKFKREEAYEQ